MKIRIEYEAEIPDISDATYEELDDFVNFEVLGGCLKGGNPYNKAGATIAPDWLTLTWEEA